MRIWIWIIWTWFILGRWISFSFCPQAFSTDTVNFDRSPTIITNDPLEMPNLGNRVAPSFGDLKLLNLVYGCPAAAEADCVLDSSFCMNDGYLFNNCTCVCPPQYTGDRCELNNPEFVPRKSILFKHWADPGVLFKNGRGQNADTERER